MIIRNKANVSAQYFLTPIFPEWAGFFPLKEGIISCRQPIFSKQSPIL